MPSWWLGKDTTKHTKKIIKQKFVLKVILNLHSDTDTQLLKSLEHHLEVLFKLILNYIFVSLFQALLVAIVRMHTNMPSEMCCHPLLVAVQSRHYYYTIISLNIWIRSSERKSNIYYRATWRAPHPSLPRSPSLSLALPRSPSLSLPPSPFPSLSLTIYKANQ